MKNTYAVLNRSSVNYIYIYIYIEIGLFLFLFLLHLVLNLIQFQVLWIILDFIFALRFRRPF